MRILACEMPDGAVKRLTSFEPTLAWFTTGRTDEDKKKFVSDMAVLGIPERGAQSIMEESGVLQDPRYTPEFKKQWADANKLGGLTEAVALDLLARHSWPQTIRSVEALSVITAEIAEHRTDPAGKSNLRLNGNTLTWHMPGVREKEKDLRRRARSPKIAAADVDFFKALEAWLATQPNIPPALETAMAKKRALRDVTADPAIEVATTPEELRAVWPDILK